MPQPYDYSGMLGNLPSPGAAFNQGIMDSQQMQANQQAMAAAQQQAQAQAQQQAQYQAALQKAIADPKPGNFAMLSLIRPDAHEAIKSSWDMIDKDSQQTALRDLSAVFGYARAGDSESTRKIIQNHIDADKAAGHDVSQYEQMLGLLDEEGGAKKVAGIAGLLLSSVVPDKFAETFKGLNEGADGTTKGTVVGRAVGHYEGNKWITDYRDPDPTHYDTIKNADGTESVIATSPSTGGAGNYTGGWTPRARNGGDNPDAAVDGKISGAANFLGVAPTADISNIDPMKIAQAMTLSEGGAGSLADRNNNPGNIRGSGGEGGYKKFPTKADGLAAAAALVKRKLAKGQTTIQSLIEGLPVGAGSQIVATSKGGDPGSDLSGDAYLATLPYQRQQTIKAIAEGRSIAPKPGTRFGQAILEQVAQYDPTFDAANAQSRQKTRVDFTSGKSATAVNALNTALGHLLHLDDQAHDLGNSSFMPGWVNPVYNKARRAAGDTKLPAFEQTKQAAASEMRKVFAGSSGGNLTELKEWQDSLDSSQSYEQLHSAIQNGVTLMASRLDALKDQYTTGMGRSDQVPTFLKPSLARKANDRFGIDLSHNGDSPSERQGTKSAATSSVPPAGATKAVRNPQTGKTAYLVNGKWVVQ